MQLRALWCFPLEVLLRQFGRIDAKESTIPAAMNFVPTGHFSHPRKWMKIWSLSLTGYFLCWLSGQRIRSFCEFWHHVSLQRDLLQCTALNNFSIRFPFEGFSHEPIKLYWEEHSFNDSLPALNYHSIFWVFFTIGLTFSCRTELKKSDFPLAVYTCITSIVTDKWGKFWNLFPE